MSRVDLLQSTFSVYQIKATVVSFVVVFIILYFVRCNGCCRYDNVCVIPCFIIKSLSKQHVYKNQGNNSL